MTLFSQLKAAAASALSLLFPDAATEASAITINQTKPEFTGDYTVVCSPS